MRWRVAAGFIKQSPTVARSVSPSRCTIAVPAYNNEKFPTVNVGVNRAWSSAWWYARQFYIERMWLRGCISQGNRYVLPITFAIALLPF
jgi:hypothetical protein